MCFFTFYIKELNDVQNQFMLSSLVCQYDNLYILTHWAPLVADSSV